MLQNFAYYVQIMFHYVYAPQIQHFLSLKSQNHEYQQSLFIYFQVATVQFHRYS